MIQISSVYEFVRECYVQYDAQYLTTHGPVKVAAACCGCYGFRPTVGLLPTEGTIMASASLETVAWLADSPDTLYKVGQALGLPGGAPPPPPPHPPSPESPGH